MRFFMTLFFIILSTNIKAEIISRSVGELFVVFVNGEISKGDMQKLTSLQLREVKLLFY